MLNMAFRQVVLLVILFSSFENGAEAEADCDSYSDCDTCTSHSSWFLGTKCRWCPCDQACHAFGSLAGNSCNSDDNIIRPDLCSSRGSKESGCQSTPAKCSGLMTCLSCTQHRLTWSGRVCRWCPLDRQCHDHGSLWNSCREDQNIKMTEMCYDKTYGSYNPDSAFANTLLSAVAYSGDPQNCIDKIYPDSGFRLVDAIGRSCSKGDCFAYTAKSDYQKIIVLAFRGTIKGQLFDEMQSILTDAKVPFYENGEVQRYFKEAHDNIMECAQKSIQLLLSENPDYDVVVTGHSLGGALASLAAMTLVHSGTVRESKLSLYAFGMPRVGDKGYALYHDKLVNNSWRVVHRSDIVSHLPICGKIVPLVTAPLISCRFTGGGPYHHRTEIFYNDNYMTLNSSYKICEGDEDERCSNGVELLSNCLPDGSCLKDHLFYFQINVGKYCEEQMYRARSASIDGTRNLTNILDMWPLFPEDKCMRIPFKAANKENTTMANVPSTTAKTVKMSSAVKMPTIDCWFLLMFSFINAAIYV